MTTWSTYLTDLSVTPRSEQSPFLPGDGGHLVPEEFVRSLLKLDSRWRRWEKKRQRRYQRQKRKQG